MLWRMRWALSMAAGVLLFAGTAAAGEADVVGVDVKPTAGGRYRFLVTVRHADEGWSHYADRWEVIGPDDTVLATRVLRHPHVEEQPFTRGLPDVEIPRDIERVTIRAHDSEHGFGGEEVAVDLPDRKD
jgi:hypothetical protein